MFQLLVGSDAYLPNMTDGSVEILSDLAVPDDRNELTDRQAEAVVAHLERGSYWNCQLTEIAPIIKETPVGTLVSTKQLPSRREKVDGLHEIAMALEDSPTPSIQPEPSFDRPDRANESVADETRTEAADDRQRAARHAAVDDSESVRLLNIGATTLGRRNLSRAVRQADYLDAFSQTIHIAIDESVDAVIQSGQFFQHRSPPDSAIRGTRDALERLAANDIPFYLTYSSKEQETEDGRVDSLIDDGLLKPIGGRSARSAAVSVSVDSTLDYPMSSSRCWSRYRTIRSSLESSSERIGRRFRTLSVQSRRRLMPHRQRTSWAAPMNTSRRVEERHPFSVRGRRRTPSGNASSLEVIPDRGVALYTIDGGGIDAI